MTSAKLFGRSLVVFVVAVLLCFAPVTRADVHELRIPLRDGKLSMPELSAALSKELGLPAIEYGTASVDVRGLGSSLFVSALNKSLGQGCQMSVDHDSVILRIDPSMLPHSVDQAKLAARTFTATAAPDATANQQAKYGLLLPPKVRADGPIVILLHGVDCTRDSLSPLAELLEHDGYQVGYFGYPDDQPLADSSKLFAEHLSAFHEKFPESQIDVVAFSMGGLVARSVIEGPAYTGGVNRFIMLAPPNQGSSWAHVRLVLEAREQWDLWRHDPQWSPSWMITDGLGEAGRDLLPDSKFLKSLNALPRRDGVKYTIVNGNVHTLWKLAGQAAAKTASAIGPRAAGWICADTLAAKLQNHRSDSDGPVSQASTQLDGVTDVVTVAADHNALYEPADGNPPAAWETIRDRLKK
ncbi:hypothetical protein BH10PLA1_BH10PLA1_14690 [soil metagenome]